MSRYFNDISYSPMYLEHHGIKGQRWHERRFQNPDGSLTEEGKKRYSKSLNKVHSLESKASDYSQKSSVRRSKTATKIAKLNLKADKATNKANRKAGLNGLDSFAAQRAYSGLSDRAKNQYDKNMAKAGQYRSKANRIAYKAEKLDYKATKYHQKGQKIVRKLNKDFGDVTTKDLDPQTIEWAKKYTQTLAA